ncbi:MAG TPA: NfeD family protein [Gemmatimonadaceae bacterium]|jgi:membrane protein implicated in regulation of membrane protease activity
MTVVYIGAFIAGLLIAVGIMLFGIERRPRDNAGPTASSARQWLPLVAAFAIGFGVAGYSLSKILPGFGALVAGLVVGLAVVVLTAWLVAKSASMPVEHDVDDERYVLQGHVARVVASIQAGREGQISFDYGDEHRTLRARSLDDASVDVGTEVVIERIEGDLAYVEPWLQVEQRL